MGLSQAILTGDVPGLVARRRAVGAVDNFLRHNRPLDEPAYVLGPETGPDRAFAGRIARSAVRHLGTLGARLEARLTRGLPPKAGALQAILLVGAAEILRLGTPAHAAVDCAVRLAHEDAEAQAYAGLVNAVLRRLAEEGPRTENPLDDMPEWIAERWREAHGLRRARAIAAGSLMDAPLDLSVKSDPGRWAKTLGGVVLPTGTVRIKQPQGAVTALPGYDEGEWWVQDAAARLAFLALGDVRGQRVLDMCAAPGGKTAALAAAGAHVTALDRSTPRMARVVENLERLNLKAETIVADATKWSGPNDFDMVLVDAPCTATGTLRRHPDAGWLKGEEDLAKLVALQGRLLTSAVRFARPGGRVVYATCSLEPEEGEGRVDAAPAGLKLDPVVAGEMPGTEAFLTEEGTLRARPDHWSDIGGVDGFFVARFAVS